MAGSEQTDCHVVKTTLTTCSGVINTHAILISKEPNYKSTTSCLSHFDLSKGSFEVSKSLEIQDLFLVCLCIPFFMILLCSKRKDERWLTKINIATKNKINEKIKQKGL